MTDKTSNSTYADEIDLRQVIQILLGGWRWIAAATLVGGLAALAVSLLLPKQHQASAAIVLTKPDVVFNFDPRITTQYNVPPGEGLPELATSDGILADVIGRVEETGVEARGLSRSKLAETSRASISGSMLSLIIRDSEPQRSADLANAWAEIMADRLNQVFAPSSEDKHEYANQAKEALASWQEAQQDLVAYQSANREEVLADELSALHDELQTNLHTRWTLGYAILDSQALVGRIDGGGGDAPHSLNDLATLMLVLQSVGGASQETRASQGSTQANQSGAAQVLMQLDESSFVSRSIEEQRRFLLSLVVSMQVQRANHVSAAAVLEESIPEIQGALARAQEARHTLEAQRDLAREAYRALERKAQEARLTAQDNETVARIANRAVTPSTASSPRIMLNAAMGGMLGLVIAVIWCVGIGWWSHGGQQRAGS